jgi:DNA-binding PadR family transcriptional regulator
MDNDLGSFETEMKRGFLQLLVLAILEKGTYGYAMVRAIRELGYEVEENTLYPLLRRLEKNKWIRGKWDVSEERPRKFYAVTDAGRDLRVELVGIWKKQDEILKHILKEGKHV